MRTATCTGIGPSSWSATGWTRRGVNKGDNKSYRNRPIRCGLQVGQKVAICGPVYQSRRDVPEPWTGAFNPKVAGLIPARPTERNACKAPCRAGLCFGPRRQNRRVATQVATRATRSSQSRTAGRLLEAHLAAAAAPADEDLRSCDRRQRPTGLRVGVAVHGKPPQECQAGRSLPTPTLTGLTASSAGPPSRLARRRSPIRQPRQQPPSGSAGSPARNPLVSRRGEPGRGDKY